MSFWPNKCQAAISLTFDDGMASQRKVALPALDEHGLHATFYLNPRGKDEDPKRSESWQEYLKHWLPAQQKGHEMGNHTVMHPCSLNIDIDWLDDINTQQWNLERIEADIKIARERLETTFPSQKYTSFAYPCYESTVGRGTGRVSYTPVVARHFIAARAGGELDGNLANDPQFCDLHHLSSWSVQRQPGALMIGLVEIAASLGRWGVFTFHGIQEGHMPVSDGDFVQLLDHLVRRQKEIWTAPVAEVAAYVKQKTQKHPEG
jgi:peptidoglycan-N-acetylglucosamine deacetylase